MRRSVSAVTDAIWFMPVNSHPLAIEGLQAVTDMERGGLGERVADACAKLIGEGCVGGGELGYLELIRKRRRGSLQG